MHGYIGLKAAVLFSEFKCAVCDEFVSGSSITCSTAVPCDSGKSTCISTYTKDGNVLQVSKL